MMLLILLAAVALVCATVIGCGLWIATRLTQKDPHSAALGRLTVTGLALLSCQTAMMLMCFAAWQLQIGGPLGELLRSIGGLLVATAFCMLLFSAAGWILARLGCPSFAPGGNR